MRTHLARLVFPCIVLATVGCSSGSDQAASPQQEAKASSTESAQANRTRTEAASDTSHACSLLVAADFESVGLSQGKAKADKTISGTECTWDPVLGSGGFLHLQTLGAEQFEKRKQRAIQAAKKSESAGGEMITVDGLGDDAFVQKWKPNETITVRAGEKAFHISGNARLKQPQLESLARAVLARL